MSDQNETKQHRFILIGAGGIGTWLAAGLVRLLEWKFPGSALIIVDGDTYEEKNKERQDLQKLAIKPVLKHMSSLFNLTTPLLSLYQSG